MLKKNWSLVLNSIAQVPGIGQKFIESLNRLGCYTVFDLLTHFPVRVIPKIFYPNLKLVPEGSYIVTDVTIYDMVSSRSMNKIICNDGTHSMELIFFKAYPQYLLSKYVAKGKITVSGKLRIAGGHYQVVHPKIYDAVAEVEKIEIIYPLTQGVTSQLIHKFVLSAIEYVDKNCDIPEWLSPEFLQYKGWVSLLDSIKAIHNPKHVEDISEFSPYRQRIAFDELLASQIAVRWMRELREQQIQGVCLNVKGKLASSAIRDIGFTLTMDQESAVADIVRDQQSQRRMMRLLQGDVGSGKTLVALLAMLNVVELGLQAALMVPTDILANQHYQWFKKALEKLNVRVELLTSKVSAGKKKTIVEKLQNGEVDIIIGTHAIFQQYVSFYNLALVVIDEQHRFGVQQRIDLMDKGKSCDLLAMSATPIPRTLSMAMYGDMDISIIKQKPSGRLPIRTLTISASKIDQLTDLIQTKIDRGEKVYWVCPLINESEEEADSDKVNAAAVSRFEFLQKYFKGRVGLLHGKMKKDEKEKSMNDFAFSNIDILVATTVIEVGIDVPQATLIIIEQAEKFGLSQLHQLRGRVGRSSLQSDCILLFSNKISHTAVKRLSTMKNSNDGFYIAEEDLKLRGSGEILGRKQSGMPSFRTLCIETNYHLLSEAASTAERIFNDKSFLTERYQVLIKMFGYHNAMMLVDAG